METDNSVMKRVAKADNQIGWALYNGDNANCRWTSMMAQLGIRKTPFELTESDILHKTFASLVEAEEFYTCYGMALGFGIRKSHKKYNSRGALRSRTWLCSKEGHRHQKYFELETRKKEPKLLSREGCRVMFRVNAARNGNAWTVTKFSTVHSHPLASATHVQFINSNRNVTKGTLQVATSMNAAGIRKCNIMGFMAAQVSGYNNVKFLIKDLYNKMYTRPRGELVDGDAAAALGYLYHKSIIDSGFFGNYCLDAGNRLENLMWADSRCRKDYKHFGHTLAFDTTYKTNLYGKPFLVLVGINNRFRTCIFGFCLMSDETTDSYVWALSTFLDCMYGLKPLTVVTDRDLAIKAAICQLMPNSKHRLCSMHLLQNATSNVKNPLFLSYFKKLMKRHYTAMEFDNEWVKLTT